MKRKRKADSTVAREIRALEKLVNEIGDDGNVVDARIIKAHLWGAKYALHWQENKRPIAMEAPSTKYRRWAFSEGRSWLYGDAP